MKKKNFLMRREEMNNMNMFDLSRYEILYVSLFLLSEKQQNF